MPIKTEVTSSTPTDRHDVSADAGRLVLRLALAAVMAAHAYGKVAFLTMAGTASFFAEHGFPGWTAWPVMLIEAIGAVLLAAGVAVRVTAVVLAIVMLGAIKVHLGNGWLFAMPGGGWEYPAFLLVTLVAVALLGPGRFAVRGARSARG